MMLINGQGQLAEFQREQERLALGRVPEYGLLATPRLEANRAFWMQLAERKGWAPRNLISEWQSAWNVGFDSGPEIEGRDDPTSYPVRSSQKPTGLAEGFKNVCERWSIDPFAMAKLLHLEEEIGLSRLILSGHVPPVTGDLKDRMALVIGISIGLGELFDDDKNAELQWLTSARSELSSLSPLEHMLKGDLLNLRDVVELLDNARGLR